jgi:hypothetical protein
MLTRSSIFVLAIAAAIGAAASAPTGASAKPVTGVVVKSPVLGVALPQKPILGVVMKPPVQGIILPPKPILGVVMKPPIQGIVINPPHPIMGIPVHDHDHDHDHDWDHDHDHDHDWDGPHMVYWHHQHSPWHFDDDRVRVSAPVATVPAGPCTCLTKDYLQDGSVLFKDVCTKEAAMATPDELRAQAHGVGPQAH